MKTPFLQIAALLTGLSLAAQAATPRQTATEILAATGVQGGLVVHLGSGDGALTTALRANDSFMVQGLDRDAANVAKARASIRTKGQYGPVSVDQLSGDLLPYIDNLANLVVAEDLNGIAVGEIKRVLTPNGVAYLKQGGTWQKVVKTRTAAIDEWTHYFYDAKGNAVSKDEVVAPPERLQWVGSPRWSRHHDRMASMSAMVSAGGRLFYIMDEGSRVSILLPAKWHLIARDAFNGVVLWKLPIARWHNQLWPLKSGPTQLARRLVGDGDRIFVTPGINDPVVQLDAATGRTLRTYDTTRGTEEILHANGLLLALVNPAAWVLTDYAPKHNTGDQKRVETEFNWDGKPRQLQAVDVATGKQLWKLDDKIAPLSLGTDGNRIVYFDDDKVHCLDAKSGKELWASTSLKRRKLFEFNYAPRLVMHRDVVLFAGGDGEMKSFDAATGKELWTSPHDKSGYRSPEDLLVAGGLVWSAPLTSGNMSGVLTGRDPRTGEVKKQFPPNVSTYWFHHRCYVSKATEKYIMPSRTGIEFVDHAKEDWDINHWVRGGCLYGVMPANGLTYAPPHNCACYPEAKLYGLNALSAGTTSPHPRPFAEEQRLLRGPAHGRPLDETDAHANEWPAFRHDNARSGYSDQQLNADLAPSWEVNLGGRLTAMTIAGGKVFVAKLDNHTVYALDANTGKTAWQYTPGSTVDSPPTFWKGRVLFGCADGRVYCLRASDGELIWRYQAAPSDRRMMAFEQLESVWPVNGSVMVEDGKVSFVTGRSAFLDGGMFFLKLDAATGKKLVETRIDDRDPETGKDLQVRLQTLQMPVGLNDILTSDGKFTYLRSQKIDERGQRLEIGPISGNAAVQGGTQRGEGAHLFAPMGFLDDTWFHRSYWVYGRNFAGGHNGYYQAGKYAPAGRILVFDDKNVYGYGREAKYLKWTTTLEHQLFSAPRQAPDVDIVPTQPAGAKKAPAKGKKAVAAPADGPIATFPNSARLDPAGKELTVEVWVLPDGRTGTVLAQGGPQEGFAITLVDGTPVWQVRAKSELATVKAPSAPGEGWQQIVGVLTADRMRLHVNGKLVAEGRAPGLLSTQPRQPLDLGGDTGSSVGDYAPGSSYTGLLDQLAIFHQALPADQIQSHYLKPEAVKAAKPVLFASMDFADARDESGGEQHGVVSGVESAKGRLEGALWFRKAPAAPRLAAGGRKAAKKAAPQSAGSNVKHAWNRYVPVVTRAMAMAGKAVFIAGAPDVVDEEYTFERLTEKDNSVAPQLREQDEALEGKRGGSVWAISVEDGKQLGAFELKSPPVWDGMAVAHGSLFVASMDGKVRRFGKGN